MTSSDGVGGKTHAQPGFERMAPSLQNCKSGSTALPGLLTIVSTKIRKHLAIRDTSDCCGAQLIFTRYKGPSLSWKETVRSASLIPAVFP